MSKPTLTIKKNESATELLAKGSLNVQHAKEVKNFFQQAIEQTKTDTHLQLQATTAFDVSAIQLSYLLKYKIEQTGNKVKVTWPEDANLRDLLEKCGITKII
jgi:hypothetical protein